MTVRKLIIFVVTAALTGCSSGGGGSDDGDDSLFDTGSSADISISGTAQKGPYQPGGTVTAMELDAVGAAKDNRATTDILANGDFEFSSLPWQGPTEVAAAGTFFNETTGNFSSDSVSLRAIVDAENLASFNVNLYTHFLAARMLTLMAQGSNLTEAQSQAQQSLEALVGITNAPSELNLALASVLGETVDNDRANLLLFSAAVLAANIGQDGIDGMANDFADDGQMNNSTAGGRTRLQRVQDAVPDDAFDLLNTARQNIQNQFMATPPSLSGGVSSVGWLP